MIDYFKVGYYYKYIGNENEYWWDDNIKLMSNGGWYKCIEVFNYIKFEGMKNIYYWNKKNFIETKYSPKEKIKKLLKEIK